MGCSCCRMVKSFSGDPTIPEDVTGHKHDPSTNSLVSSYQCHRLSEDGVDEKEGFQNYGYVSSSPTKFDIDNNHINQSSPNQPKGGESNLYILQPDGSNQTGPVSPSAPPLSSESMLGTEAPKQSEKFRDSGLGNNGMTDEGDVGDTADDESVISVDIHTSSTSLSSTDTKLADDVDDSITDAMVAEALAALEAATAGEEYE